MSRGRAGPPPDPHPTFRPAVSAGAPSPAKPGFRDDSLSPRLIASRVGYRTVAVSGSTITFTDRSGPLACGGATKVGRYTRKAGPNGSFRLTAVKDACAGRKLLLTSGAWNQKK